MREPGAAVVGPLLATARSAALLIVFVTEDELLAVTASTSALVTVAVLVMDVPLGVVGLTRVVMVTTSGPPTSDSRSSVQVNAEAGFPGLAGVQAKPAPVAVNPVSSNCGGITSLS